MATVTIEIPDELAEQFKSVDEIRRTVYEDFIIEQRQQGNLSLSQAAELLGLTYTEFFDLLGKKGLSFINATPDELDESSCQFERVMEHADG
jgi:predicted HTH domain antitoxin